MCASMGPHDDTASLGEADIELIVVHTSSLLWCDTTSRVLENDTNESVCKGAIGCLPVQENYTHSMMFGDVRILQQGQYQ